MHKHKDEPIKVANISLAFKLRKVIQYLSLRGRYLKFDKLEKAENVRKLLDNIYKNYLIKMTTPIKAFITFDTLEGKDRAVKYLSK